MKTITILATIIALGGCRVRNAKSPSEDIAVQADTLAHWCEEGKFSEPCPPDLQEHLDLLAAETKCMMDMLHARRCEDDHGSE